VTARVSALLRVALGSKLLDTFASIEGISEVESQLGNLTSATDGDQPNESRD
jgi:hypothetical protein